MRSEGSQPAGRTLCVASVALLSLWLGSCSTGGLDALEVGNPAYATAETDDAAAAPSATLTTEAGAILPLTAEQDAQAQAATVPEAKPGAAPVALQDPATPAVSATTPAEPATATAASAAPVSATDATATTADVKVAEVAATPVATTPAPTQFIENNAPGQALKTAYAPPPKKRGFLAGLFSASEQDAPVMSTPPARKAEPVIKLASTAPTSSLPELNPANDTASPATESLGSNLPGVRQSSLFEITRKSGLDDDSDVDLHEDEAGPVQFASAAGMGRLAPNGLLTQRESVDVACLKPSLVRMLKQIERHYGKRVVITSGYRSPTYNKRVRGARNSMHMYCAAVDLQIPGVTKWEIANYVRALPARGGVGTYCHTESVHIDVGPERDWNWRCRRRKG